MKFFEQKLTIGQGKKLRTHDLFPGTKLPMGRISAFRDVPIHELPLLHIIKVYSYMDDSGQLYFGITYLPPSELNFSIFTSKFYTKGGNLFKEYVHFKRINELEEYVENAYNRLQQQLTKTKGF